MAQLWDRRFFFPFTQALPQPLQWELYQLNRWCKSKKSSVKPCCLEGILWSSAGGQSHIPSRSSPSTGHKPWKGHKTLFWISHADTFPPVQSKPLPGLAAVQGWHVPYAVLPDSCGGANVLHCMFATPGSWRKGVVLAETQSRIAFLDFHRTRNAF